MQQAGGFKAPQDKWGGGGVMPSHAVYSLYLKKTEGKTKNYTDMPYMT
jgi:hypothetical protein